MTAPRRRRGERGQAIAITAIFGTVLLGAAALAVDLSLAETRHRDLQNATDAAALVGARDLGSTASQAQRRQAAIDALRVVYDHMGWGSGGTGWATSAVDSGAGSVCVPGGYHCDVSTPGAGASNVQVTVNVPPRTAPTAAYDETSTTPGLPWGYVEVVISRNDASSFAGVIGFATTPAAARSVGYHFPGGVPFGFALYTSTVALSGNTGEVIQGNIYAYRDIQPQSSGQAGFCAATDPNGNPGTIVVGAPQSGPFPSPDPAAGAPYQSTIAKVQSVSSCTGLGAGAVAQTAPLGGCGTLTVQGVTMSTTQDPGSLACMANPPVLPPDLQGPSRSGSVFTYDGSAVGSGQSVLTVTGTLTPGLYVVTHNPTCIPPSCADVVIDGHSAPSNCPAQYTSWTTCLLNVTFELDKGATIRVANKAKVLMTPYLPPSTTDPNDGRFSVYAPLGSAGGVYLDQNGTQLSATGTLYLPSGTVAIATNASIQITGQAIVASWQMQSGYHLGSEVVYDNRFVAQEREVLQLVQ